MAELNIALAQLNLIVGDINGNTKKIIEAAQHARDHLLADLVVFHELTLTNYSPEDLLYHQDLYTLVESAIKNIAKETKGIDVLLGYPEATGKVNNPTTRTRFNSAAWLRDGEIFANYRKQRLPNYSVFDEKRYFAPGTASVIVEIKGIKVGILICEDIWHAEPTADAKAAGAQIIVSLNASPFSEHRPARRLETIRQRISANAIPMIYVNQVGAHDELLFDGGSMAVDRQGDICCKLPHFIEKTEVVAFDSELCLGKNPLPEEPEESAILYQALVMGVKDYAQKNGFKGALLGLSGGIDSALTLAIAVDALGADNVEAILLPSPYTSQLSLDGALEEVNALQVKHQTIPINAIFDATLDTLKNALPDAATPGITEQNLQARIRGNLLMALSNKTGRILLTTGNKSELAVGYATLYGDMAGGFAVLKDVYKTLVYKLARYRNGIGPVIPEIVINREPTAELAPNQKDQDDLPPYEQLDQILEAYIEQNCCFKEIVAQGFSIDLVKKVIERVNANEYKRRQSPPGTRITSKAFGRDWRYPITSKYINYAFKP